VRSSTSPRTSGRTRCATYASLLFEAGVDLVVVQELLGHADLATTRAIYVHLTERVKREAADLLAARLRDTT
jgi:site-specific recombinase XerD